MLDEALLKIDNLKLNYGKNCVGKNITLTLKKGEVLGIVGESGSGKSTLLKAIIDPELYGISVPKGSVYYKGMKTSLWTVGERRKKKGAEIGMILQNPYAAFNPIRIYKKQFKEVLRSHSMWQGEKSIMMACQMLEQLGLGNGQNILASCPYEMSGGMNQRIAIVLAMLLQPSLLLADEPTSALDVTSQSQVIEELWHLRKMSELSMVIVSHNLSVIAQICDVVAIMYKGEIVEKANVEEVLLRPSHWYTKKLIKAIP